MKLQAMAQDAMRGTQPHFCDTFAKAELPESNDEGSLDKPKLRNIFKELDCNL